MDSIFDEDVDEVGGEIEAYCPSPRCKADTTHTIISMYEDEVRRVQCVVCGDVHAYRKPRGDSAEEASGDAPKRKASQKPPWEDALQRASDADLANCRPYSIRDTYEEGDLVSHPVFDIGTVTELLPDNKVEITFKEGPRILVHNRGDLASRMPGISETPPPREAKKKKRAKKPGQGKDDALPADHKPKYSVAEALELARQAALSKTDAGVPAPAAPSAKGGKGAKPAPAPAAATAAKGKPAAPPAKGKPAAPPAKPPAKPAKPAKAAAKPAKAAKPAAKKPAPKKPAAKKPAPKKPAAKKPAPKKPAPKKPAAKKPAPKAKAKSKK